MLFHKELPPTKRRVVDLLALGCTIFIWTIVLAPLYNTRHILNSMFSSRHMEMTLTKIQE